ncbi:MAG: bifunctional 2',3'-cyclic-nucleotide 2'-phosphodiesterase/3'-nucleotidase [Salinarimonadaceae bacterium]|nr:MAG: bifunctional 2',3'-cyclic-nucleotide 2'-phosphodiesterase/3'-nucleotidase [Salinarimonadaceae bacterium]
MKDATELAIPSMRAPKVLVMPKLRLIATSDLHIHVRPYDYFRDEPDGTVGLAALAPLIERARSEAPGALLFDNGDFLQGSPLGDVAAADFTSGAPGPHPMITAMNLLGCDAGAIGNHEFNYGLAFLDHCLRQAAFPIVCANLRRVDGAHFVEPWSILEHAVTDADGSSLPLRVGVIGFVPPQVMQWDSVHLDGHVLAEDIVEAARREVPLLRAAGADIVVALCHSGIVNGAYRPGQENAAAALAEVDGVDALVAGHQHLRFPGAAEFDGIAGVDNVNGTLSGKPAIMPCCFGMAIGVLDLDLARDETGWRIVSSTSSLRFTTDAESEQNEPDAAVMTATRACHKRTLDYVRETVGETDTPIHSYFALLGDNAAMEIVAQAQLDEARMLLAQAGLSDHPPLLSAAAPFKAGGRGGPLYYSDITAGPLTMRDLANLYLYPNTVCVVRVSGRAAREWLERSAGIFNRIKPGAAGPQRLVRQDFPSYHFDVIFGLDYLIDLSSPARHDRDGVLVAPQGRRIVDLRHEGRPVRDEDEFLVATNNYRAGGGGTFFAPGEPEIVASSTDLVRDVVTRYVARAAAKVGRIEPRPRRNWRFAPFAEGANVIFHTGPGAEGREPADLAIERIGPDADGFLAYRLRP